MEEADSSVNGKSDILERSYCQGVKRIAHQSHNSFFQLPKHLIKKRQKAWNKFFEKYNEEVNDYEITMNELGSDVDDNENDLEKKSDPGANNVDTDFYFVKNRTPIRKLPALVQYWVDTGNPPFQLDLENDDCESSFNEEQKSSPLIIHTQSETEDKRDHSTSFLSSVDTAAYILSNTNVTKKADTLAIVEGAKKSDSPIEAKNVILNISKECPSPNGGSNIPDKNSYNVASGRTSINYMNDMSITAIKSHILTVLDPDNIKNKKLISSESCDKSLDKIIMETSVKITDVLPTLEQIDKSLNENARNDDDEMSNVISYKSSQPLTRKKLYTTRASPIDLIISNSKKTFKRKFNASIAHPALQATPTINASKLYFKRRTLRYSRKRKSIARNRLEKLSDKSSVNSTRTRKSHHKRSNIKSISLNHKTPNNSMNNLQTGTNDNNKLKNTEKKEDLVELCKKKNLLVKLPKIPDDKLIGGNIRVEDIEKLLKLSHNWPDEANKSSLITSSTKNNFDILELDSQESDQSTIIICECIDKNINKSNNEMSTDSYNKIIVDDDDSDIFIGTLNKLSVSSRKEEMSPNLDENKKIKVDIQSPLSQKSNNSDGSEDQSWRLQLTFSSDEEDDFVQMIRQKTDISKSRQTQIEDKITKDANKTEQALSNYKNDTNFSCKFGAIASSDDDEKKILKIDNTSIQKRKSLRRYSHNKNVKTISSDETVKIETTLKQKRTSTNSRSKKFNKHSGKVIVEDISLQNKTRKTTPHINVKLNYSASDSSSENITPLKKLRTTSDDTSNGDKKKAMNDTNSTNESMISLKEDFSLNKKNLNDLIKPDLTVKPDQTFQSKRQRRSNLKTKKDSNASENGDHQNKCYPKDHISLKKCSISIVKCPNLLEDVVDSGLSSILSSNDKISKPIVNDKLECKNDLKSISPVEKRNQKSHKSLKRKSNMSKSNQPNSVKSVKKLIKSDKNIFVTYDTSSEEDSKPRTRRQSAMNKSSSSNPSSGKKKRSLDTLFPDPINDSDVLEITVFSRSRRSQSKNVGKAHINKTLSNSRRRNGKIKFHTGMCSDSDS